MRHANSLHYLSLLFFIFCWKNISSSINNYIDSHIARWWCNNVYASKRPYNKLYNNLLPYVLVAVTDSGLQWCEMLTWTTSFDTVSGKMGLRLSVTEQQHSWPYNLTVLSMWAQRAGGKPFYTVCPTVLWSVCWGYIIVQWSLVWFISGLPHWYWDNCDYPAESEVIMKNMGKTDLSQTMEKQEPCAEILGCIAITQFLLHNYRLLLLLVYMAFIGFLDKERFVSDSHYMHSTQHSDDTQICGLHMRRECWERFPRHRGLAILTCITVLARRTCRDACWDR